MNNIFTPVPQFSGYPLKPFPLENDTTALVLPFSSGKSENSPAEAKESQLSEVQENWDESWFSNYE